MSGAAVRRFWYCSLYPLPRTWAAQLLFGSPFRLVSSSSGQACGRLACSWQTSASFVGWGIYRLNAMRVIAVALLALAGHIYFGPT